MGSGILDTAWMPCSVYGAHGSVRGDGGGVELTRLSRARLGRLSTRRICSGEAESAFIAFRCSLWHLIGLVANRQARGAMAGLAFRQERQAIIMAL